MKDKSVSPIASDGTNEAIEAIEGLRPLMFSIAYRMLGSVDEAEDIVQEAYLRFHRTRAQGTAIESPKAFLSTVTTRLAIDAWRAARTRRETYVGVWLPEPLMVSTEPDPAEQTEEKDSLSLAFLVLLQTLSPVERAVFLLRDIFDYDYGEIAAIVRKSEDNCRQILARARKRIEAGKPRFDANPKEQQELATKFFGAADRGDLTGLVSFLTEDATFFGDGGGKAHAYRHPLIGNDRVALAVRSIFKTARDFNITFQFMFINGQPGALSFDPEGRVVNMLVLDISGGVIHAVRSIVNPEKLRHLGYPVSDMARIKKP